MLVKHDVHRLKKPEIVRFFIFLYFLFSIILPLLPINQ
jgi:hypothetical protein